MDNFDIKSFALGASSGSGGYPEPTGTKNITENGDYNIKDYASAHVAVEQGIVPTGTITLTENKKYDVTNYAEADVQVPEPTPVEPDLVDITITQNGTYNHPNHDGYDEVTVAVANSYTDGDIGKVVDNNKTLVSQSSRTVTVNGTYSTPYNNEVVVNVPSSGGENTLIINDLPERILTAAGPDWSYYAYGVICPNKYIRSLNLKTVPNGLPVNNSLLAGIYNYTFTSTYTYVDNLTTVTADADFFTEHYMFRGFSAYAFCGCRNLTTVPFPPICKVIDTHAFDYCQKLVLSELPSDLEYIGSYAFRDCEAMTWTHIPATVKTIAMRAFADTARLQIVVFDGTPTSIASDAFYSCSNITDVYVPWSYGAVAGAPWGATNATIHYDYVSS